MRAYHLRTALQRPEFITGLYLNRMDLTEVPPEVFRLPNLRELDLSYNRIERLPEDLEKLSKLERLVLSHNRLERLPLELGRLRLLAEVWLDHNALARWPEELHRLPALRVLKLDHNQLEALPESAGELSGLRELDLSHNQIGKLPGSIGRWKTLRELKLSYNRIGRLPVALGDCRELDHLDLSHNRLRELSPALEKMERLSRLDISNNRLTALPAVVCSFTHLRHLCAANNRIAQLPAAVANLRWLAHLDLGNARLNQLNDSLLACTQLQTLRLSRNDLTELPPLASLTRLRSLEADRNQLRQWPALPPGLRALNLSRNSLPNCPAAMAELHQLEKLDLSHNPIPDLPEGFGRLAELRELDLRRTALQAWPTTLLQLDRLEKLKTDWPVAREKTFLRLLRVCVRAGTPVDLRDRFFRLLDQGEALVRELSPNALLHAAGLRYPELRRIVRPELFRRYGIPDFKDFPGDRLCIVGKTALLRRTMVARLKRQQIEVVDNPEGGVSFVLLGDFPEWPPAWQQFSGHFLTERQVIDWLDRREGRYLRAGAGPRELDRLRALLLHDDPVNVQLAVQMLQGGGVPVELLTELLIAWKKAGSGKLRRILKQLLWQYTPEAARGSLEAPLSLSPDQPEALLRANIERVCAGTPFLAEKLWRAVGEGE